MIKYVVLLLSFCFCIPGYANTGKISEYKLPNGLKLIVKEDHRAPVVISQVWYKVGSGYEPNGITGISHMLEHMMFRGTKKYGPGKLKQIIADNGGNINAQTSYDYTMYYEVLAADKLPIAFELEADRMHGLSLNRHAFQNEHKVVMEEWRMRLHDNPQSMTYERFMAAANIATPYHHMTIGWLNDIKHYTVGDVRAWYHKWYAPNNAIVVVVGDVDPKKVYNLANQYFGAVKAHAVPQLKPQTELKTLGERQVNIKLPAKLPWLIMGYNVPSLKTAPKTQDAYALEVVAAILDGGDSARIPRELVRGQQLAVDAGAYYPLYSRLDNVFLLEGTPTPNHSIAELKEALLQQIQQLQTTLVSTQELAKIKAQVIASETYNRDSMTAEATEIGSLEVIGLSWHHLDLYAQNIATVTPKQIQAVARKYLTPNRLTVATLSPQPLGKQHEKN
jgi:zinc protease